MQKAMNIGFNQVNDNLNSVNFSRDATLRYKIKYDYVDDDEMAEIENDTELQLGLQQAYRDANAKRGRIVQ